MHTHRVAPAITVLLTMLAGLEALATPAYAQLPLPDGPATAPLPTAPTVQATSGTPLWVFALVVLITAVLTVGTVMTAQRFKAAHPDGISWSLQPHHT